MIRATVVSPQAAARITTSRVLLAMGSSDSRVALTNWLERAGAEVVSAPTANAAINHADVGGYQLIILGPAVTGGAGADLCRRMRVRGIAAPIFVLLPKICRAATIEALDVGADAVMTMPPNLAELEARMRALLRFAQHAPRQVLTYGTLELDLTRRQVARAGERVCLTPTEFALLHEFIRRPGAVLSRDAISQRIWGMTFDRRNNVVMTVVSNLRRKLGNPRMIQTLVGVGYALSQDPSPSSTRAHTQSRR
jgi:DNA-binding response OmpR family regulator